MTAGHDGRIAPPNQTPTDAHMDVIAHLAVMRAQQRTETK